MEGSALCCHPPPQGSRPATSAMRLAVTPGTHGSKPRNSQQYDKSPACRPHGLSPEQVLEEQPQPARPLGGPARDRWCRSGAVPGQVQPEVTWGGGCGPEW